MSWLRDLLLLWIFRWWLVAGLVVTVFGHCFVCMESCLFTGCNAHIILVSLEIKKDLHFSNWNNKTQWRFTAWSPTKPTTVIRAALLYNVHCIIGTIDLNPTADWSLSEGTCLCQCEYLIEYSNSDPIRIVVQIHSKKINKKRCFYLGISHVGLKTIWCCAQIK